MQKNDEKKGRSGGFAPSVAKGFGLGLAVMLVLLAIFAWLISSGRAPQRTSGTGVTVIAFAGALVGSMLANKMHKAHALAIGAAVGGSLFALSLVGSALSENGGVFGGLTPALFFAFAAGGISGSLLSVRKKKRRHS